MEPADSLDITSSDIWVYMWACPTPCSSQVLRRIQTILPVCEVKIWLEHLSTIVTSVSPQLLADFYYRPPLHRLSTTYVIVMFRNVTEGIQVHRHVVALLHYSAEVHRCAAECLTHCWCSTALQVICKLISACSLWALSASDVQWQDLRGLLV